jgi:hypothetical protein
MAGELFLKMKELNIFKPLVMDTIINEFEPDDGQFVLTNAFLPMKMVNSLDIIDMVKFGTFGRTYPVNLGAEHARLDLPGWTYRQYGAGHWREGVLFNEDVLLNAMNPASPLTRMAEDLVTEALNLLDLRINNLIERVTLDTVIQGFYTEARWGVNYEYNPQIPPYHYIDINNSGTVAASAQHAVTWSGTGASWNAPTTATPLVDIVGAVKHFRELGYDTTTIWMNDLTAVKIEATTEFKDKIKVVPTLVQQSLENEDFLGLIAGLKGQKIRLDSRMYREDCKVIQAAASGDTVVYVDNANIFKNGDKVIVKKSDGKEAIFTLTSAPGTNYVTLPSAIQFALSPGDRIITSRKLFPTDFLILEGRKSSRASANNWISTPSLVSNKSISAPSPGRYTWNHFATDRPPYNLEVGAGISGGPKVGEANWMVVYVGTNGSSDTVTTYWKNT